VTILLVLALVAVAFAVHRQVRRIDALEQTVAALVSRRDGAPGESPLVILPTAPAERTLPERPPPAVPEPERRRLSFEQLVGGKLPIWVGGAALAIAGYFLVSLALESGLLTPWVRVALAVLFGGALLAAGEAAARLAWLADDPRVHQALAGAGIATLYAAAYLAGSHYGLIGPIPALVMMALVTALALALSLRRGMATALMGLIGGFATPLLAGTHGDTVVPLLLYLGLLSAGLFGLAVARGWLWLALTAAAGSLWWSGFLIATAPGVDALAAGGFALLLALAATGATAATAGGDGDKAGGRLRALPPVAGAAELAMLVADSGFGAPAWGLYLLLSAAAIFLGWRDSRLAVAVAAALGLAAVALVGGAEDAPVPLLAAVSIAIAVLFGGAGHVLAPRPEDGRWWAAIGAAGLIAPYFILWIVRNALLSQPGWAVLALLLGLVPLHLAWRSRAAARTVPPFDAALTIGAAAAALFAAEAIGLLLPTGLLPATLPVAVLLPGIALAEGGRRIGDGGVLRPARFAAGVGLLLMLFVGARIADALGVALVGRWDVLSRLPSPSDAVAGALLPALLLGVIASRATEPGTRSRLALLGGTGAAAAAGLYVLWKQLFGIADQAGFVADGFLERALLTQVLFAGGWAATRQRWSVAGRVLTGAAALRVLWFDLIVCNPAFVAQAVGPLPLVNLLTIHFALAAGWVGLAWAAQPASRGRTLALVAFVAVAIGGMLLAVRQAFHGSLLVAGPLGRSELYGYSAGGVLLAVALFGLGAALRDRQMRIAGLGLLTMMVLKVFLVDAAALQGLLRVASFLGLGITLIGIGWVYDRVLRRGDRPVAA
jgi:uncharacterized membrane protein